MSLQNKPEALFLHLGAEYHMYAYKTYWNRQDLK